MYASRSRLIVVWTALMLATGLSWLLGHSPIEYPRLSGSVVLAIAFLKVRFVGLDFMELRQAPATLRWVFEGWVFLTCAAVIAMYYMGA